MGSLAYTIVIVDDLGGPLAAFDRDTMTAYVVRQSDDRIHSILAEMAARSTAMYK